MKKTLYLAIFGLATSMVSSYGVGYVVFSSYFANNVLGAATSLYEDGSLIGVPYQADLYYSLGTVSDPVNFGSVSSITSLPTGMTDLGIYEAYQFPYAAGPGYFGNYSPVVTIPGYTSGPITFEVVAFNSSSYADSTIRGRSGTFTMNSIGDGSDPIPSLGDNGNPMPDFLVAPAPEPTTLALAGLGIMASLAALRRKLV
jgi:hypothetical protein